MERKFYKLSRTFGKIGTTITDIKALLTFDPKVIAKRWARKKTYQSSFKGADSFSKKVIKWFNLK